MWLWTGGKLFLSPRHHSLDCMYSAALGEETKVKQKKCPLKRFVVGPIYLQLVRVEAGCNSCVLKQAVVDLDTCCARRYDTDRQPRARNCVSKISCLVQWARRTQAGSSRHALCVVKLPCTFIALTFNIPALSDAPSNKSCACHLGQTPSESAGDLLASTVLIVTPIPSATTANSMDVMWCAIGDRQGVWSKVAGSHIQYVRLVCAYTFTAHSTWAY